MVRKRKIIVYIAVSADGFIARLDGSFDWLDRPRPKGNLCMDAFYKSMIRSCGQEDVRYWRSTFKRRAWLRRPSIQESGTMYSHAVCRNRQRRRAVES